MERWETFGWAVTSNRPITQPEDHKWLRDLVEIYFTDKFLSTFKNRDPVPLCKPQIRLAQFWNLTAGYKVIHNSLHGIALRLCAGRRRETFECYAMLPDDCHEDTSSVNKPYQVNETYAKSGHPTEEQFNLPNKQQLWSVHKTSLCISYINKWVTLFRKSPRSATAEWTEQERTLIEGRFWWSPNSTSPSHTVSRHQKDRCVFLNTFYWH